MELLKQAATAIETIESLTAYNQIPYDASKEVRALIQALADEVRGKEWQPIETAPKDGRDVLLYLKDEIIGSGHWSVAGSADCWFTGGGFCHEDDEYPATHWQPLPHPPKEDK